MEQLKPCPFCNDRPYTQVRASADRVVLRIGCGECGMFLTEIVSSGISFDMFEDARKKLIAKWNRRVDNGGVKENDK